MRVGTITIAITRESQSSEVRPRPTPEQTAAWYAAGCPKVMA